MFWRLEMKPRRSGKQKGQWIPHFHLLLWFDEPRGPRLPHFREFIAAAWNSIVEPSDLQHKRVGTSVDRVKNTHGQAASKLMNYLAKYLCKQEAIDLRDYRKGETLPVRTGRVWGFKNEDAMPTEVIGLYILDEYGWESFIKRVNDAGDACGSWYWSSLTDKWRSFALLGDGRDLMKRLCSEIDLLRVPALQLTGDASLSVSPLARYM